MIELIHLEKKYENATPLRDVNTVINDGDVISVIGPSGTGKSTDTLHQYAGPSDRRKDHLRRYRYHCTRI